MSKRSRPPRSLQAKALQLLAQREQSRVELRRKLIAHARATERLEAGQAHLLESDRDKPLDRDPRTISDEGSAAGDDSPSIEARVDAVMAWLEAHHFSSDARFAESRVHARQGRFGNLRIRQELATHAIELSPEAAQQLIASELQRAVDVCERKFTGLPVERAEAARQGRFLIARGFSADTVRQALRQRAKSATLEVRAAGRESVDDS